MEIGDLDNLSSAELRKLITLMSRETTLKRYKHVCDAQRKCSSCEQWFCYACYNWHLNAIHGPAIAQFNGRLDEQINIVQQERAETRIAVAQFNARLDASQNIIQNEEKTVKIKSAETRIKIKVKVKLSQSSPREAKSKTLNFEEIQQQVKDGTMSKEQLLNIIAKL